MTKIIRWARNNLFIDWLNTIMTLAIILCLMIIGYHALNWLVLSANFFGTSPNECTKDGACWVFVRMRLNQFLYGFYPRDLQWRINLSYVIGVIGIIMFFVSAKQYKKWYVAFLTLIFPVLAYILYHGNFFGLEEVDTYSWGGLHLTLVVAYTSIILSLPLGIILALARRSKLPVLRVASMIFIELWLGVPLISVLFMASVLIPMFFSPDLYMDKVLRALIGITLFYSAYIAELIRHGMDALPVGQYEAAKSLGFNYFNTMRLIILPQTLKTVTPNIVNTFISMFKNTTLILIIGLFDFLGMIQAATDNPKWQAYEIEGYVFAALVFWIFCFLMSRYSKHLEHKQHVRLQV